jgi:hypothetical protein
MKRIIWLTGIAAVLLLSGCSIEERVPVEMAKLNRSQPAGAETSLQADVGLDIGALVISGESPANVYSLDLEYDKANYQPDVNYTIGNGNEGRLSLNLESMHKLGIRNERRNNRLELRLSETLPLNLRVKTGIGDARLALTHLRLRSLDVESGVGGGRVSAYERNGETCDSIRLHSGVGGLDAVGLGNLNFKRFEFEGGVGGASLDFSGEWQQDGEIRIQVGVGGVTVRMPREVGVRVTAEKHFLSGLQLDGFRKEGADSYYSENYNRAKIRVSVIVRTGVGGFRLSWL